jgi:hypothetical protein
MRKGSGLLPHLDLANGQGQRLGGSPPDPRSYEKYQTRSIKALKGITHPSKASGATPARYAHTHPSDSPPQKQKQVKSYPWSLILKPIKECSTPPQAQGLLSGIKILGYPIDGKIRHLVRSLKPHRWGPSKVDSLKARTTCQSLMA